MAIVIQRTHNPTSNNADKGTICLITFFIIYLHRTNMSMETRASVVTKMLTASYFQMFCERTTKMNEIKVQ